MQVEVIDPVSDYAELMQQLFDFDAIRALLRSGFRIVFDAMHAVTGPYAKEILENQLGAPEAGSVRNFVPEPDFGGHHPDPNLVHAKALYDLMMSAEWTGFRRGLRRGRRPQPDPRQGNLRDTIGFACTAGGQCPAGARICKGAGRHRPFHADQRRRRPCGGKARHRHVRNTDRLEVLRQSAGCRQGDDLRRGKCRHGVRPCSRKGWVMGGLAVAEHSCQARRKRA